MREERGGLLLNSVEYNQTNDHSLVASKSFPTGFPSFTHPCLLLLIPLLNLTLTGMSPAWVPFPFPKRSLDHSGPSSPLKTALANSGTPSTNLLIIPYIPQRDTNNKGG